MTVAPHVIVIGAGIIGASAAYHLARGGARVTVLAASPGGVATPNSFSWINASWSNDPAYFRLRFESMQQWRRLEQEIPGLGLSRGGSITYDLGEPELRRYAAEFGARGYPLRLVTAEEIRQLTPNLATPPEFAVYAEAEGAVEQGIATAALLKASAAVFLQTTVHGLDTKGERVVCAMTSDGPIAGDHFVLAAGMGTVQLLATLGVQLDLHSPPGLIVHTRPLPRLLRQLIIAPEIHIRQTLDGKLIAGSDFAGSPIDRAPGIVAEELMSLLRSTVRGAQEVGMARYTVGYRPMPRDEHPIAGPVPGIDGLYVAVMHSGITNAPALGAAAAEAILKGSRSEFIKPYGIERFLESERQLPLPADFQQPQG
jgi:glycine/D-amino acid oxidase-like deaminating enzyme